MKAAIHRTFGNCRKVAHFVSEEVFRPVLDEAIFSDLERSALGGPVVHFTKVERSVMRRELSLGNPPLQASQKMLTVAFDNYLNAPSIHDINENVRQRGLSGWMQMKLRLLNDES